MLVFSGWMQTALLASAQSFSSDCEGLKSRLNLENTTVYFTQFVSAGSSIKITDQQASCKMMGGGSRAVVDICRIAAYTATSPRSGVNFETWLPSNWTGRFISHGNSGLSGCISYGDLSYSTSLGFAAVSGNSGHNGSSGAAFLNNPDVIADFVWRSVHTGVVAGKQMTNSFYGKPHTKSYYLGCSTGGRQGFKAVQYNPEDFDGVVAGAPAFAFNNLTSWSGNFYRITGPVGSPSFIPTSMWPVIVKDAMKQCDAIDGLIDGIIEDPSLCSYDPKGLACTSSKNSRCLTPIQLESVRLVYSPLMQKDGSMVYPRLQPGTSAMMMANGQPFMFTQDWFRYAIYNDPNWDPRSLNLEDMAHASKLNPQGAETWDGDLSAFKSRGAKVIHYHGHEDQLISSANSARYYEHVRNTMKLNPDQIDSFYRYFQISGMGHCGGGPGAHMIGQSSTASTSLDPNSNVLMALVRWVEQGLAPETIKGTKFNGDSKAKGIKFQRQHCRYPRRNRYDGKGNAASAESWQCIL